MDGIIIIIITIIYYYFAFRYSLLIVYCMVFVIFVHCVT